MTVPNLKAITVDLNPLTFITLQGKRLRWQAHSNETQKTFLDLFLYDVERHNKLLDYAFEFTKKNNVHVHATVDVQDDDAFKTAKNKFVRLVSPRGLSPYLTDRLIDVRKVFDHPKWSKYLKKAPISEACPKAQSVLSNVSVDGGSLDSPTIGRPCDSEPPSPIINMDIPDEYVMPTRKLF